MRLLVSGPAERIDALLATSLQISSSTPSEVPQSQPLLSQNAPTLLPPTSSNVPWQLFESLAACSDYDITMLAGRMGAHGDHELGSAAHTAEEDTLVADLFVAW